MNKPSIAALALTALALLSSGCGVSANAGFASAPNALALRANSAPQTEADFVRACAALGVKLTSDQLATISADRAVQPNGAWAPRPADNLTADQNLQVHFLKHGSQFHPAPATPQAYLAQAMALAEGRRGPIQYYFDTTSFAKGYQSHVVIWNAQSQEMTAMREDGAMTTYYLNNSLAANRFVVVPRF